MANTTQNVRFLD